MTEKKNTRNKILSYLIGDVDKWKKLPSAFSDLREDMKDRRERWILIGIGLFCFTLAFSFMYLINEFQNSMQFCEIIEGDRNVLISDDLLIYPEDNMSYKYYVSFFKEHKKPHYLGLNCSFDIMRGIEEWRK